MAVVVVEDERADAQLGGGIGRRHERRYRPGLLIEVIGQIETGIAHGLNGSGSVAPPLGAMCPVLLNAEPKRPRRTVRPSLASALQGQEMFPQRCKGLLGGFVPVSSRSMLAPLLAPNHQTLPAAGALPAFSCTGSTYVLRSVTRLDGRRSSIATRHTPAC